jgi:hypothetical protein
MAVFEPEEAKAAITVFSLTGAIGNALGKSNRKKYTCADHTIRVQSDLVPGLIVGGVFGIDVSPISPLDR